MLLDHLQKTKNQIKKFKETGDSRCSYQNELDKDLNRKTFADKVLRDKAFNIAKYPKYDGYQRRLASMVYKFFDKKTSGSSIKNENIPNKKLAAELYKPITRKFNKKKSTFTLNTQYLGLRFSKYAINK